MTRVRASAALFLLCSALAPRPALSAPPARDAEARAIRRYEEGNRLLQGGDAKASLAPLEESMRLLPSPNTELLIAHAYRQLGDEPAALERYVHAQATAKARVAGGEGRFSPTVTDAGRWIASLTPLLAELTVNVSDAPEGATLLVNGKPIEWRAGSSGSVRAARTYVEPGLAKIELRAGDRSLGHAEAALEKGASRLVTLEIAGEVSPAKPAPGEASGGASLPPIAAWVAGGIGAAGMISFAVAGGIALDRANELDRCAPGCDPDDPDARDARDTGKTASLVANVSAAVGGAGLITGALLWIFWPKANEPTSSVALDVGPGQFDLRVRF